MRSVCLFVCVCLSVCEHPSGTAGLIFRNFSVHIPCDHGSVLVWRLCSTLCTSGFMDDVMFGRNGWYGDAWKAYPQPTATSGIAILGRSLMSMNALFWSVTMPAHCCTWNVYFASIVYQTHLALQHGRVYLMTIDRELSDVTASHLYYHVLMIENRCNM